MYKTNARPSDNPDYRINKPDSVTIIEQKLLLVHQFTFPGSPHIWNGDEVGMWGADDPDCRKPIVWDDLVYDDERTNYYPDKPRPVDIVKPDKELLLFYRQLIRMRKENPVLSTGDLNFLIADDDRRILVYSRGNVKDKVIAVFNRSGEEQTISIPVLSGDKYKELFPGQDTDYIPENSLLKVKVKAVSAVVLKRQ
jgi:cyclomaltodextrinase